MNHRKIFLLISAIGLTPVALSYGLMPEKTLGPLFDISIPNTNTIHIYRAVMGLYLASVIFWIIGAFKNQVQQAALYSLGVFMLGLAAGRTISLLIDGMPHWLLAAYIPIEIAFGLTGLYLAIKTKPRQL